MCIGRVYGEHVEQGLDDSVEWVGWRVGRGGGGSGGGWWSDEARLADGGGGRAGDGDMRDDIVILVTVVVAARKKLNRLYRLLYLLGVQTPRRPRR